MNPGRQTVDGDPCYPSLGDLPEPPVLVDVVVPPRVTLEVLRQCAALGLTRVWLQPGSEDDGVLAFAAAHGLMVRADDCIMVRTRSFPGASRAPGEDGGRQA